MRSKIEYKSLPQNPNLHTSLDHFCHSIHMCEPVTSQNYPAKFSTLLFSTSQESMNLFREDKWHDYSQLSSGTMTEEPD
jgi:hypothetical protein